MIAGETLQAIKAIFHIERAKLIAGLTPVVRNVDLAEVLAQDVPRAPRPRRSTTDRN